MNPDRKLDVRGHACPFPVITTMKEINKMKHGEILEVLTDFPFSEINITSAAGSVGHEVLEMKKEDEAHRIIIRVIKDEHEKR